MSLLETDLRPATASVGDTHALLLAGPRAAEGPEPLAQHLVRLGPVPPMSAAQIVLAVEESGIEGRGGGGFPLWRKLSAARDAGGDPFLVVNCSESEPASRKDHVLCTLRPHLVLDGAAAMARSIGALEVTVHLHASSRDAVAAMRAAVRQREGLRGDPVWGLSLGPGGYVSGEASAVARFLHEGVALPQFSPIPLAQRGPSGRPTVVSNAETAGHVGLLLRLGAPAWRAAGPGESPGPHLVTLAGAVARPGRVLEVIGRATIGDILYAQGVLAPPLGVLVGGYAGTWVPGHVAWDTAWEPAALAAVGATRGCGLIGVLPEGSCGLAETASLVRYLAGQSAGQCGPCVHGLPALADDVSALAAGRRGRHRAIGRLRTTLAALPGSGACRHPDGTVRLVQSALEAFDDDVRRHRSGKPCRGSKRPPVFPVPAGRRAR